MVNTSGKPLTKIRNQNQETKPPKMVPWQYGKYQKIKAKQIKLSRININNPAQLSGTSFASGAIGNGTTLEFNTTLTPLAPNANKMIFAIPYVAIYWGTIGIGSLQIWPNLGMAIPGTAFTVTAGFDWHLWSVQAPGTVIASFSGQITNNSMGNGTLQLVTQWQSLNFNTGTALN